jgi:hypothetical protein
MVQVLTLNKWETIHTYRHKVAKGEALAIRCPDCDYELVVTVGSDGDPALKCFSCRVVFTPGLDVWDQIKKALND